ncbi:CsgE family curli-type amyloid fiber assembly protein [Algoriphagus formosus]|mgnify:CR=1 FL=1|uniref:CsgE family curli-type amyloid fiber assembly protein n=1 Tax=Algoriphagus formosus TaxID=2007308 RepID=UPI003F724AA4
MTRLWIYFRISIFIFCFSTSYVWAQSDTTRIALDTAKKEATIQELQTLLESIKKQETQKSSSEVVLEIDGLLIDDTKTKSGRDFYDFFYRDWVAPPEASNYSIFIVEKPFRLNTTTIEISINEITVFQSFLQPRTDIVEELAKQSIGITQQYLIQYEELVRQLDGEERKGTGIF